MTLKGRLQPHLAAVLTSQIRLQRRRERLERRRRRQRRPHTVTFYHQVDDPYSYLLAQALPAFLERYPVDLIGRTVSPPPREAVPRPDLWRSHALRDGAAIAPHFGLAAPTAAPSMSAIEAANATLVAAEGTERYLEGAGQVGEALWRGETAAGQRHGSAPEQLRKNRAELHRRGHYLGGMLHYEGEWYWGIDRLAFLEERLADLGVGRGSALERRELVEPPSRISTLEFYLSVRSPYSYLALDRVFDLGLRYEVDIRLKPLLPMVKRGLPVPRAKRLYMVLDAKRVALKYGIPFGRICDPLPGVERALAVLFHAEREGLGQEYVQSAMTGAWAEGIELATDRGLRRVVERAGLLWAEARRVLADGSWRDQVEQNRRDLEALGLWGVPSFRLGDFSAWGQDRIWLLEEKLRARAPTTADSESSDRSAR